MIVHQKPVLILDLLTADDAGFDFSNYRERMMFRHLNQNVNDAGLFSTIVYAKDVKGKNLDAFLGKYSGVLIPGGADLDPTFYGGVRDVKRKYYPQYDEVQLNVITAALKQDAPVVGICRGMQLLNVAAGGSLYEDLDEVSITIHNRFTGKVKDDGYSVHQVIVLGNSSHLNPDSNMDVISLHHQGVKEVGSGLTVTAVDDCEGFRLPEALEHKNGNAVGVQWHPEHVRNRDFSVLQQLLKVFAVNNRKPEKVR